MLESEVYGRLAFAGKDEPLRTHPLRVPCWVQSLDGIPSHAKIGDMSQTRRVSGAGGRDESIGSIEMDPRQE